MTTPEQTSRAFGWWDMFVHPDDDPRADGGFTGERDTLAGFLRDQRLTFELKCRGLDAAGMAARSVPPSDLSLLGLLRHLTDVERSWFRRVLARQDAPRVYDRADGHDAAFDDARADDTEIATAWAAWRAEIEFAERFTAEAPDLGMEAEHHGERITLREVLVHMVEEYARHNGHADFLRERIDGRIGQ